jgi:hypothetical protein
LQWLGLMLVLVVINQIVVCLILRKGRAGSMSHLLLTHAYTPEAEENVYENMDSPNKGQGNRLNSKSVDVRLWRWWRWIWQWVCRRL